MSYKDEVVTTHGTMYTVLMETTYKIIRFYQDDRDSVVVTRGLTLAQAQAHCRRDDTRGGSSEDGTAWFDGYEAEAS